MTSFRSDMDVPARTPRRPKRCSPMRTCLLLLSEAVGSACMSFLHRYLPCFYREEQHDLALVVVQGKLSKLERKTSRADRLPGQAPAEARAALCRRWPLGRRGLSCVSCGNTWRRSWRTPREYWSWTRAASPRRVRPRAAWPTSGAAGWARSRTARSASSWRTVGARGYAPLDRQL